MNIAFAVLLGFLFAAGLFGTLAIAAGIWAAHRILGWLSRL